MTESVVPESKAGNRRWRTPVILIRVSALLLLGLMLGHLSAYPWTSMHMSQEANLVGWMKSIPFVFLGERSTYWNLYFGWGLLVGVLLLTLSVMLWALSSLVPTSPRTVGAMAGILSANCVAGTYLSVRYFYAPPAVFYAMAGLLLMVAAAQLLRSPPPGRPRSALE
jgi:hypothetical protein